VSATATPKRPRRGPVHGLLELVLTVAVAIGLALLIQAFLVKPYKIPSGSMIPTLQIGQRILVNKLDTSPGLGDIVVFHPPVGAVTASISGDGICGNRNQGGEQVQACDQDYGGESSQTFVKRVVGLPGDHLKILNGKVFRNGVRERGSYIQPCTTGPGHCDFPFEITVPRGDYYMMGDNRGISDDSRYWGPVPQSYIVGEAFATYWPLDRIGFL
jgi:signal peptidase I